MGGGGGGESVNPLAPDDSILMSLQYCVCVNVCVYVGHSLISSLTADCASTEESLPASQGHVGLRREAEGRLPLL